MKKILLAVCASIAGACAFAQTPSVKIGGFVRNYFSYDTRENVAGTEDLFEWVPKDIKTGADGADLNAVNSFRFTALTSRLYVTATGYEIDGWSVGARIEGDFYAGVSGVTGTATMRLRQAFVTMDKDILKLKMGQAWHPMAADMPDVFALNTGAPFGPFSRTPLVSADVDLGSGLSLNGAALWQMQYVSAGPSGASADYMKYGCTPEFYFGLSYSSAGFVGRVGADVLSIRPRYLNTAGTAKVSDRITTVSPFAYAQWTDGKLSVKAKTVFAQAGEHISLNGGYGVTEIAADGSWKYSPTRNSSSWMSVRYGSRLQAVLFVGYVRNFGTADPIVDASHLYFSKNSYSNMTQMYRVTPAVIYNMGKVQFGLEYERTAIEYGSFDPADILNGKFYGLATRDLHWVANNRIQAMVKYTF